MKLTKPLVVFDIETTGLDFKDDRIIQITLKRIEPDGTSKIFTSNVNPDGIPMSEGAAKITGISNDILSSYKDKFADIADKVMEFLEGADVAGYNILKFDVPFLNGELARNGRKWNLKASRFFDLMQIWSAFEPRSLEGAGTYYGVDMDKDAKLHDSEVDVLLTEKVLMKQIEKYGGSIEDLYEEQCLKYGKIVDAAGKLIVKIEDGVRKVFINFGNKHKNRDCYDVYRTDLSYLTWMRDHESFPLDTRERVKELIEYYDRKK